MISGLHHICGTLGPMEVHNILMAPIKPSKICLKSKEASQAKFTGKGVKEWNCSKEPEGLDWRFLMESQKGWTEGRDGGACFHTGV